MRSLPVLVYHHVNNLGEGVEERQFEGQMKYLVDEGFRAVFLKDWVAGATANGPKDVAITFDDAYLDNWVFAFPILKKHGLRATLFAPTARILDELPQRANLEDVWSGACSREELPALTPNLEANRRTVLRDEGTEDFVTWAEMRQMEAAGVMDVQSHSHFHRDFFCSSEICDFNQNQEWGIGWATDGDVRYGIPLYPRQSAMRARRYFDDQGLRDHMAEVVGGPDFFRGRPRRIAMNELMAQVSLYRARHAPRGRFETLEEQRERVAGELSRSKQILEEKLEKECSLVAWPWGQYSALSLSIARQLGYRGAVTFSKGANLPGRAPFHIRRLPPARTLDAFALEIASASNPIRAIAARVADQALSRAAKVGERLRQGELIASVRRKVSSLATHASESL